MGKFFWRLNYTGYVMQCARLPFSTAWRMSGEAAQLYVWQDHEPARLADKRLKLYHR